MTTEVIVAIITTGGALLSGIVVESIKRGRAQRSTDERLDIVLGQLRPNGGKSLSDAVTRIEDQVGELRELQREHGERLAAVEARVSDHIKLTAGR